MTAQVAAHLEPAISAEARAIHGRPLEQKPYWDLERARIGETRKVPVEVIVNGQSVAKAEITADGSVEGVSFDVPIKYSSWVALRIYPSSHTNPVFVTVGGKPIRASKKSAEWCIKSVDQCWSQERARHPLIRERGSQEGLRHRPRSVQEDLDRMRRRLTVHDHDQQLAHGFDAQAAKFERAPVQSDPAAIERLVRAVGLPPGALVLDSGCGPGLVSSGLLASGHVVVGIDLSTEMIERARTRCAAHGERARFFRGSVYDQVLNQFAPFDAALSRFVVHHVVDPHAFLARQISLVRHGGVIVVCDHVTDPDPAVAGHHGLLEVVRDRTHTRNLTGGEFADLFARAGLEMISLVEEPFVLDFDEWFDRGTPLDTKDSVRAKLLAGPFSRSFRPSLQSDGSIRIDCIRAIIRGQKP